MIAQVQEFRRDRSQTSRRSGSPRRRKLELEWLSQHAASVEWQIIFFHPLAIWAIENAALRAEPPRER